MRIGQKSSGFQFFGVMKHRLGQEDILDLGLQEELAIQSSTTLIVLSRDIKGR